MKAPEKIYVKITHPISDKYTEIIAFEDGDGVEYVRTDTFIEKACEWLKLHINDYLVKGRDIDYMFDDFEKFMKGE